MADDPNKLADAIDPRIQQSRSGKHWYPPAEETLIAAADFIRAHSWQPIETAPKDGTWILGWAERDSAPFRISWGRNHDNKLAWCTAFSSFVDGYITLWSPQPLPLPPAPDMEKEK